jgi:carboxypeptidase T
MTHAILALIASIAGAAPQPPAAGNTSVFQPTRYWIEASAADSAERTKLATSGVSIEEVRGGKIEGIATLGTIRKLQSEGVQLDKAVPLARSGTTDFPDRDKIYHNYAQTKAALQALASQNSDIATFFTFGTTFQGRSIDAVKLTSSRIPGKPAVLFIGAHHAREHLSTEVPLKLAQYLAAHKKDARIKRLLEGREIYIVPMLNADGVEYDIGNTNAPQESSDSGYRWQRKNMRGVDLNRNYGFRFGGEGASDDPDAETYHGPSAFSEPETQAVKAFVEAHPNIKTLLSYHTFSELVMWPWGGANEAVPDEKDRAAFEKIGRTMAQWNGYTPEQSSALYVASGDTCDWAYKEHGIFAFTFELTPKSSWEGGFYPGAGAVEPTFAKNLEPALYLIELTDDPHRVLN